MLKPDELRAMAADLEAISARVGEDDCFVLQTNAEILRQDADKTEKLLGAVLDMAEKLGKDEL